MDELKKLRKIIHVDMDAFYASIEQRDFPQYKGKPLIVGGDPNSRGVVATCSYEARKFGVHSAMPCSKALKLCPSAIFVRPRFPVYKETSQIIREIFYEYSDLVEPLSLDEAYIDVTENNFNMPSATVIAKEIKQKIFNQTGLSASAGVSYNKFLAKTASDINKPDGLTVILPNQAEKFIEKLPIRKFFGIGKATENKMKKLGIHSGLELKKLSKYQLIDYFGKAGTYYYYIARGIDLREVNPNRIRKSYGKEKTFSEDKKEWDFFLSFLQKEAFSIAFGMQKLKIKGKTITVKVRYDDFETVTRSQSLKSPTYLEEIIYKTSIKLLEKTEAGERAVRLLGITLSNLISLESKKEKEDSLMDSLFPDEDF